MDEHTLLSPWPARDVHHLPGFHNIRCAVLVPIVKADGELHLLYEVRRAELKWQPCDISFPGGKIEAGDMSPQAAAVREAMEELYLKKEHIQILGALDYVESITGFTLYPFAARLDVVPHLCRTSEVEYLFTVPLKWLAENPPQQAEMDLATRPGAHFPADVPFPGNPMEWRPRKTCFVYIYRYGNHRIWGMTAQITKHFIDLIQTM